LWNDTHRVLSAPTQPEYSLIPQLRLHPIFVLAMAAGHSVHINVALLHNTGGAHLPSTHAPLNGGAAKQNLHLHPSSPTYHTHLIVGYGQRTRWTGTVAGRTHGRRHAFIVRCAWRRQWFRVGCTSQCRKAEWWASVRGIPTLPALFVRIRTGQ
jgi:hypothetical protein